MKACASCNGPFDLNDDASFKALERAARSGKVAALKYLNEWRRLKERINAKA